MDVLLKIISVVLALGGFIGLLAFKRQQAMAMVMFVVFAVGLCLGLYNFGVIGEKQKNDRRHNEYTFYASRAAVAAKHLAGLKTGDKLVVIVPPGYRYTNPDTDTRNIYFIDGLKKGFGSDNIVVAPLEIPNYNLEEDALPIEDVMKAEHFDAVMNQYPDAGAFVSLVGLPSNVTSMAYFRNRKAKAPLALIGVPSIVPRILIDSIEKGDISCMVIRNPELRKKKIDTSKLKATDDFEETFKMRFVLVTKDNLEQYKEVLRD